MIAGPRGAPQLAWRLLDVAVLVLAAVAVQPPPGRHDVWTPPESVELVFPGGPEMANAMQSIDGRIVSRAQALLVFRWLHDPVEVSVEAPEGPFELRLGNPAQGGAALAWDGTRLRLSAADAGERAVPLEYGLPSELRLAHADGRLGVLGDGRPLGPAVEAPAPPAPATLLLEPGSSMEALAVRTSSGETRRVRGHARPSRASLTAWALLTALAALAWWHAWRRAWRHGARPDAGPRRTAAVVGVVVALALLAGLPLVLARHNAARMVVLAPCETGPFALAGPAEVVPCRPLELGDRRDGDLRLTATVTLDEGSVLDLLLRAELPRIDRQVLVTLSTDPALPGGLSVNLGTSLRTREAPHGLARLPAGRPLRLEVTCRDERTTATVDGTLLGSVRDFDLRAGRTAFHALGGRAVVSDVRIEPLGPPRALTASLVGWQVGSAGVAAVSLALLAWCLRRGAGGWGWAWPVAASGAPGAATGLLWPAVAVAALLLLLEVLRASRQGVGRVRCALALAAGAALLGASAWAHSEVPAEISSRQLNELRPAGVAGPLVPASHAWARHPLCRRFNGYLKTQSFRDGRVLPVAPAGTLRVVAIGTSSTFGYGVAAEEAWPARCEEALRRGLPGRDVEVVNAGVPGSTAERLRFFVAGVVLGMRPDVVVVDLGFNDHTNGGVFDERAHFEAITSRGVGPLEAWWRGIGDARRARSYPAFMAAHQRGEASPDEIRRMLVEPAARFGDSLRDMVSACRAAGVDVLFVQEPMRPSEDRSNLTVYHDAMAAVSHATGVPVVSPQAQLEPLGDAAFLDIVHPRAVGHRVIGEGVAEALLRGGLAGR